MLATNVCPAGHTQSILLTGYWPPTNEMLRKFSTDPAQNPSGWQGQNWEGRGYDVYAFFPEFPGGTSSNPKGDGDFEVDYQDVASWQPPSAPTGDFWRLTDLIHPVAIMSFGQGAGPWEIEFNARNLASSSWNNDYLSPTKPTPAPPDSTQATGYVRHSSLPAEAIAEAVNSSGLGINAWVDWDVNPGAFLCEYMAYHDAWYQSIHSDPNDQYYCVAAGFTHIASGVSPSNGTAGVEAALRALIGHLDLQLTQYTISGTATAGGSPLAGVTMCGLPGNPVTNGSGGYTAQVGGGWSGTVTPLKSGYAFTQKTYSNILANQSAQDYTASAATADTIVFDAATSTSSSSSASTTLSWLHTVGSGNNRVLVVGVVAEDNIASDQIISSVKFNSVNMTPVPGSTKSRVVYSGTSYSRTLRADLYYMLNPPVGTYTVLITYNGSVSYRVGGAVSLANVKQQAPEAVITNGATSAAISTALTVPNSGAWIVDVVGHSNSGSFTTSTTTERWDKNSDYHTGACGTKAITTPGSNTISWTYSGSSGTIIHSLAAFAPSETVVVPPTRTLTVSTTTGGTVTTPGIGDFDYPDGDNAGIIASADTGYHFVNWTGSAVTAGKVTDPNSASATVLMDANYAIRANFAINRYSITGSVVEIDGDTPVAGVLMSAGDINILTDANGLYQLSVEYGWSGVITPVKDGYTFEPSSNTYSNVTQNYNDVNYTAELQTFVISGYILGPDHITPISDINVSAEYGGGQWTSKYGGWTSLTDANGYYEVVVDYNWSGRVIPARYAYAFEPNNRSYTDVNSDWTEGQSYIGTLLTFRIAGCIKNKCDVPIAGVMVSADNGGGQDTTDSNGCYEVWVDYSWSGTVTPAKQYYTFDPNLMSYTEVLADRNDRNYEAENIYDLDCNGSIDAGDISVMAENWLLTGAETAGDFNLDETVNFLDFAEFGIVWGNE